MLALSLVLLALPARLAPEEPTWQGATAAEWVARIGEVDELELFASLRQLGPAASLPALTGFVLEAEPARAWVAVRALDRIEASGSAARAARDSARNLARGLKREGEPRLLAVLALAALGEHAEERVDQLAKLLESELPRERLVAALALTRFEGEGREPLLEAVEEADPVTAALACGALTALGPAAEGATKGLVRALGDRDSGRAALLARSLLLALAAIDAQAAERALEEREELELGRHLWNRGGFNWGGLIAQEPETLVLLLEGRGGLTLRPVHEYELPRSFQEPLGGGHMTLLEGVGQALAHLAGGAQGLAGDLEADHLKSWELFDRQLERWVCTVELLDLWCARFPED